MPPLTLRAAIGEHLAKLSEYIIVSLIGLLRKSGALAMINMMNKIVEQSLHIGWLLECSQAGGLGISNRTFCWAQNKHCTLPPYNNSIILCRPLVCLLVPSNKQRRGSAPSIRSRQNCRISVYFHFVRRVHV